MDFFGISVVESVFCLLDSIQRIVASAECRPATRAKLYDLSLGSIWRISIFLHVRVYVAFHSKNYLSHRTQLSHTIET